MYLGVIRLLGLTQDLVEEIPEFLCADGVCAS